MNNIVKNGIERATDSYEVSVYVDNDRDILEVLTLPEGVSMDIVQCSTCLYVTFRGNAEQVMDTEQMLYDLATLAHTSCISRQGMAEAHL